MKKILLSISLFAIFATYPILSKGQLTFKRIFSGFEIMSCCDEYGSSVQQTNDGGYIVAGTTVWEDAFLLKTDALGNTLWVKTYGGTGFDYVLSVQQTSDDGYILAGGIMIDSSNFNVYLIKTDFIGDTIWTKSYGGIYFDYANSVQQTNDGGYIITGTTIGLTGSNDFFLFKTDSNGILIWSKTYGGIADDFGKSVQQTNDGGYIVTGYTESFGVSGKDIYFIRTDSIGDTLWTKIFGGIFDDWSEEVIQTTDGGFIIIGSSGSFGTQTNADVYLIKTDSIGDIIWTKIYGDTTKGDNGMSIQQTLEGGYILAGSTNGFGPSSDNFYLIKTNQNGDTIWTKAYQGGGNDFATSVHQTSDGGYIFSGNPFFSPGANINLIKTDSNGYSGCNDLPTNTTVYNTSTIIGSGGIINSGGFVEYNTTTIITNTVTVDSISCYAFFCNLSTSITTNNINCNGNSNGIADLTVSGGTIPYSYNWSNGDTTEDISGLTSGTYSVTITDNLGCIVNDSITISEPSPISLTTDSRPDTAGTNIGIAWVVVSGGTPPYSYQWDDLALQTTDTAYNLSSDTYNVVVTDYNGCKDSINIIVDNITGILDKHLAYNIQIYPNPNAGKFIIEVSPMKFSQSNGVLALNEIKILQIKVLNITGKVVYQENQTQLKMDYKKKIELQDYTKGIYNLQIITDTEVINKKVVLE